MNKQNILERTLKESSKLLHTSGLPVLTDKEPYNPAEAISSIGSQFDRFYYLPVEGIPPLLKEAFKKGWAVTGIRALRDANGNSYDVLLLSNQKA